MTTQVDKLINQFRGANGKWSKFARNFSYKVVPFFSRATERAAFDEGFDPVMGVIVRNSLSLSSKGLQQEDLLVDKNKLFASIKIQDSLKSDFVSLFKRQRAFTIQVPSMMKYYPLSESKQAVGEVAIGEFIAELYDLKHNDSWLSFLSNDDPHNPYETLLVNCELAIPEDNNKKTPFWFFDQQEFKRLFDHDLTNLLLNPSFFHSHSAVFFAFYYFIYIIHAVWVIGHDSSDSQRPNYYALDGEQISQARPAAKSYRNVRNAARELLIENDILDYLNYLSPNDQFMSYQDFYALSLEEQELLGGQLREFIRSYLTLREEEPVEQTRSNSLREQINILRKTLRRDENAEPISRFSRSLDEITNLDFAKARGRLGKVFNLTDELIIVLIAGIVGKQKMLLNDFFAELNKRNIWLDRPSRENLTAMLTRRNILEKMSDSGDAQYVKSVL